IRPLSRSQRVEVISCCGCLTGVKLDRIEDRDVEAFVHESVSSTNSPEWSGPHHVCRALASILNNPVTGSDIVQSKITERVNDLVSKCCGHCKRAAINECSWCRR